MKLKRMFYIKFCVKCDYNFGGFLEIHVIFYKNTSKIKNGDKVQQNYL